MTWNKLVMYHPSKNDVHETLFASSCVCAINAIGKSYFSTAEKIYK